jgi:hypothetical protein
LSTAIVRTCKRLQVIFLINLWSAIVCICEWLQVISYFVFRLQSFARMNDCKPFFIFLFLECNRSYVWMIASHLIFCFWTAIIRTYEWLQAFFLIFNFWSAIIRTCKQLQVISYLIFQRAIVCMYESSLFERSEGMDWWSWSNAPRKNPLVIKQVKLIESNQCSRPLSWWKIVEI